MPTPEHSRPTAAVCGLTVPLTGKPLFLLLCAGYLGSALGFAALQERVFEIPGFKFSGWMTFVTAATMAVCGMLERLLTRDLNRVGTLAQYAALSVLTVSGMGLTNLSLNYLTYPTRVIFKSSKLLPTMAVGTLLLGRKYSFLEYVASAGLVTGIVFFTMGDAEARPSFNPIGIVLIVLGIGFDAATSNYEERAFFRIAKPASQAEVVAFSSLFGSFTSLAIVLSFSPDEIPNALAHASKHREQLPYLVISSVCGYVSVSFVLLMIKMYGATVTEMVKSLRKVLTLVISFVLFAHPVTWKYGVGGLFVVISLIATQELQRRKGGDVKHIPPKDEAAEMEPLSEDVELAPMPPSNHEDEGEQSPNPTKA